MQTELTNKHQNSCNNGYCSTEKHTFMTALSWHHNLERGIERERDREREGEREREREREKERKRGRNREEKNRRRNEKVLINLYFVFQQLNHCMNKHT